IPPIRRARPRARTRRCPMDRAGWCAAASPPGASGCLVEPRRFGQRLRERATLGLGLANASDEQIAALVDVAAQAFLRRQAREVFFGDPPKPLPLPGADRDNQRAREALAKGARAEVVEALVLQRRRERPHPRLLVTKGNRADHGAEYQPVRRLTLVGALRPG